MITVLHRGGYAQMITILHRGGGSLGTPKSDYVICARPLKCIAMSGLGSSEKGSQSCFFYFQYFKVDISPSNVKMNSL